ncbi:MAG: twin-arginine translocase TatA/TatE family subunit [Dehalococcoidia bacterium]
MPFGIGWQELLIVLAIVLVIFGAGRVPEIARSLGKGIREFKSSVSDKDEETKNESHVEGSPASEKR